MGGWRGSRHRHLCKTAFEIALNGWDQSQDDSALQIAIGMAAIKRQLADMGRVQQLSLAVPASIWHRAP